MPENFIGRGSELTRLRRFLASEDSHIAVIHGRRRIGKSMLIRHALQDRGALMFDGLEGESIQQQIRHFMHQLQASTGAIRPRVKRWEDALQQLHAAVRQDPRPIVFDELQWMAGYRRNLVSILKSCWDLHLSQLPAQKLILCGSIASFMLDKVANSASLYGRVLTTIAVRPFKLSETREMLGDRGIDEVLQAHLLTGGVPQYLHLLRAAPSVQLGPHEIALQPDSYFAQEYDRIFISQFGRNSDFETIVRALAQKPMGLMWEDLAASTGLSPGGLLSEHLRDLEVAGFMTAERPFHRDAESRETRYRLRDAFLRFYFGFLHPHLQAIQAGHGSRVLAEMSGSGALASWMGHSFEHMCVQHAAEIARLVGFSDVDYKHGPYFAPNRRGAIGLDVALVFDRSDKVLTVCETKYSLHPVGVEVIADVKRKIDRLSPFAEDKTIQPVLVVHPGASRDLVDQAYFYKIIEAHQLMA